MGLEQAPPEGERIDAHQEITKLQDNLPAATLASALDFTPRPTKVADMGMTTASVEAVDTPQYIEFGGDIYGQKKGARPVVDTAIAGGYTTKPKTERE
ncbi:MAG: hypothetical protein K2Y39_12080 [Candidatus Obscuribacterales bacterium]|nr:hypothetical protein [Candidatus Obscuribacterales bacterium]